MKRWMKWAAAVAAVLAGAWVIATLFGVLAAQQESREDRAQLERQVDQLTAQARKDRAVSEALKQQIQNLGESPAVEPSDVPDDADVVVIPGQKGERGESCIEEIGYPRCRGAAGREGNAGTDGADSVEPGPAGAPGKDGTDGVDGKDGAPGADGRGITDAKCGDDDHWTLWWSDGTTSDGGLCRVAPGNSGEKR